MTCRLCIVRGHVQGVFFRASTQREAYRLGLSGYAHNLPDGSVEVLACGESAAVQQLCDWLWQGPPSARVTQVECVISAASPPADFTTG